jgi:hypothetical protein
MSVAGIKNHFANWRQWELNPIVIKELRQAVRSWAVTGMLLLFLTVLFITSLIFLVTQSFEADDNMQLGGSMFSAFLVILVVASVFFIPLYVGVRVAVERQENNAFDTVTGNSVSLKTRVKSEAVQKVNAMNETERQPSISLGLAKVYLNATDPKLATRTWQEVMENIVAKKTDETRRRWETAIKDRNFDCIRNLRVAEIRCVLPMSTVIVCGSF